MYKKTIILVIILSFLFSSLLPVISSVKISSNRIIYVDDDGSADYTRIQDAIDNASDGDTVFVYSGVYYEQVVIDKSIILEGEDKNTTVIDGGKVDDVIYINGNGTTISGFIIQNADDGLNSDDAGIDVRGNNNIITDNIIKKNYRYGVYVQALHSNNTISNNIFDSNHLGMKFQFTSYTEVLNNTFVDNYEGMRVEHVDHLNISFNTVTGSTEFIQSKKMYLSKIFNNTITSNGGASAIVLDNESCSNKVCNNFITNSGKKYWAGIAVGQSSNNEISGNIVEKFKNGISLGMSNGNIIKMNTIRENNQYGINLEYNCNDNIIYCNNLKNNSQNAYSIGNNQWDNGLKGNYWDDYEKRYPDAQKTLRGVWNTPYEISNDNIDRYPLIEPYKHVKSYVTTNNNIIYVDDDGNADYTRIQDAIDNASDGDTVFVYCGIYYENIVIDKSIDLIGEDRNTTFIDGRGIKDVISIYFNNTYISNFVIRNSSEDTSAGIKYIYSSENTIKNCVIKNNYIGIWFDFSNNNLISINTLTNNNYGIFLQTESYGNNITQNVIIDNNWVGIRIDSSYYNKITLNKIKNNSWGGITLGNSFENKIFNNTISKNYVDGIILIDSFGNDILNNNITNNSENGIYLSSYGYEGCYNNNISWNTIIINNKNGIKLDAFSYNNNISENTITINGIDGIILRYSSGNTIYKNNISNNRVNGLFLEDSYNNNVLNNFILYNKYGIFLESIHKESSNNNITGNSIKNNYETGIFLQESSSNLIAFNLFIKNKRSAYFENCN
ncbi:MAG: right-handed parallel beta-helix repeat-containing protein, partial [Thermoplasmatales archaeon]